MKVEATPFMINLFNNIKTNRNLSDSTVTLYMKYMCILNNKKAFNNLSFLKKTDNVAKIIEGYSPNTGKTIYSSIVSVLSTVKDNKTYKPTYEHYHAQMMGCAKTYNERDTTVKTEKEEKNWVNWDDVLKIRHELNNKVVQIGDKASLTASEFNTLLEWTLLSIYTILPPRRNADYLYMYVTRDPNPSDTDKNYLVLGKKPEFIFNKFKTAKKSGAQRIDVPPELMTVLNTYLAKHPLMTSDLKEPVKLLVDSKGKPMTAINTITRILNKVFGKNVGSSMLRHSFLSEKYGKIEKERKEVADMMAHTVGTQEQYIRT
jgi:hypothetical protein